MENQRIQEIISNDIKKENIALSIRKPPVYTLKECLNFYTKAKLFDLAENHNDYVSKSKLKAEMIELVEEIILKNLKKHSTNLTNLERKTIVQVIKNENKNILNIEDTKLFRDLGYIYWFYHKNEMKIVCPNEVGEKYMEDYEKENEEDHKEISERSKEILNYIKALQNIYGVFNVDQLISVWNNNNEDKLGKEEINELMDRIGNRQNDFWWDDPYIVSKDFKDKAHYEEFLKTIVGEKYYTPTKHEVNYYLENGFDVEDIHYKWIVNYFTKYGALEEEVLDDLMKSIKLCCRLNNPFQEIISKIKSIGFKFKNVNELNKLIMNYIHLSNNTRKWNLKGYKPVELSDDKLKDNVVQLKNPKAKKMKRVGRNQPCPCGSGKKYKFCCID